MHRRLFGAGFFALAGCGANPNPDGDPSVSWDLQPIARASAPWLLIAKSDLIVRGTLSISSENAEKIRLNKQDYFFLSLAISEKYKGEEIRTSIEVKYYAYRSDPAAQNGFISEPKPEPALVLSRVGNESLLFLVRVDDLYYFAGRTSDALVAAEQEQARAVAAEVESQAVVSEKTKSLLERHSPPFDESVARLMTLAVWRGQTQEAFDALRNLDRRAVPSLVRHMGDHRALRYGNFSLSIPGAFEGLTHYDALDVGDLLMAALDLRQDIGVKLGWAGSRKPERERARHLAGWRVWLGYSLGLTP